MLLQLALILQKMCSESGAEGASKGRKYPKGNLRHACRKCLNGVLSSLALTKLLRNSVVDTRGCSQELHGESFRWMNTVQENHNLLENWRVGAGNEQICLICLTQNTLPDLAVIAIK